MRITIWGGLLMALLAAACTAAPAEPGPQAGGGMGMGMGMGGGMMARHNAPVPEPYAGRANPVPADEASLARGAALYAANCASCHGDGGMGDGPAASGLEPAPAPIAHTSRMMGDDYLLWRISEGGAPFQTAMPGWQAAISEEGRWDLVNYMRALGQGTVTPGTTQGGAAFDPAVEAAQRAAMLSQAVAQGVLTAAEAETFTTVHAVLDAHAAGTPPAGGPAQRRAQQLAELVQAGAITQAQADTFADAHQRLEAAGLMP